MHPLLLGEIFGPDGLIVIAAVLAVLLFGGTQLPKLMRSLGSAQHELRKGLTEGDPQPTTVSERPGTT